MSISKSINPNVQLLTCLVEPQDAIDPDDSYYRFLVDGSCVKYVTVAPGALAGRRLTGPSGPSCSASSSHLFHLENWNQGYVAKNPETGEAAFIKTETETFSRGKKISGTP